MKGLYFVATAAAVVGLVQGRPQVVTSSSTESSTSVATVAPPASTPTTTPTGPGPPTTPTNPYGAKCPVASNFIINDFQYANGPPPLSTWDTSFEVKYGELELKCPIRPGARTLRFGLISMHCDDADMVKAVVPVGGSTVYFLVNQWCPAVPQYVVSVSFFLFASFPLLGFPSGERRVKLKPKMKWPSHWND
ncbi:uncharacterized protein BP5553_01754 [Venustampulla echinocandica]|uniref:AA1-like domain-containing protein n=1 Tax=Venustampulla echinocandica TaxID=2656787 RepID=A0A370U1Z2_9HELO|nr:uncharacterized protein BP5553_01754 [Venustampulla echinocandica]RDL41775.1 hypothetical protein BP5553_01754 [Venustampulla echinocandica]